MKYRFLFLVLSSLLIINTACKQEKMEEEGPLNVILLIIDDMGHGDLAAHVNPLIESPTFDQLHDQSARFTNFAVSPTCSPTRAALLTGKHEFLSGVTHTLRPMRNMDTESVTIAELFQKKGYKTGMFGKWHLGQSDGFGPWYRGFVESLTVPGDDQNSHFDPVMLKNRIEKKYEGYREDILFSEALNFISENRDNAFFCYLSTYAPHAPNIVPQKYSDPYVDYINPELPDGVYRPEFFGQIANLDKNIGRLLAYLESTGLDENTLLIVMNDNGGTWGVDTYNSGLRGAKGTAWSGGILAYSFWKWGDKFPPGDRNQMTGHIDVLPTLAELFKLEIPGELQGQLEGNSLLPLLENADSDLDENRMQVHHVGRWDIPENWEDHKYANSTVRWGSYTLVRIEPCTDQYCHTCSVLRRRGIDKQRPLYTVNTDHYRITAPGRWELYDIESDPFQENDIANENPEIAKKMSDFYEEWWEKVDVVMQARWEN